MTVCFSFDCFMSDISSKEKVLVSLHYKHRAFNKDYRIFWSTIGMKSTRKGIKKKIEKQRGRFQSCYSFMFKVFLH